MQKLEIIIVSNDPAERARWGEFGDWFGQADVLNGRWSFTVNGISLTTLNHLRPGSYTVYAREWRTIVPGLRRLSYYLEGQLLATSSLRVPPTAQP